MDGGPADDAGLRGGRTPTGEGLAAGGDLIVAVDGKEVKDPDDVADAIAGQEARRRRCRIEYYRGDDKKTATVKLGKRPDERSNAEQLARQDGGARRRSVPGTGRRARTPATL